MQGRGRLHKGSPGVFLGAGAETHSRNGAIEHSCFIVKGINRKFEIQKKNPIGKLITTIEKLACC